MSCVRSINEAQLAFDFQGNVKLVDLKSIRALAAVSFGVGVRRGSLRQEPASVQVQSSL